jgi:exodeoxyribonuclease-1
LINTEGNSRHDALNMIKAAFAIDENVLKTELNPKGNKSMKLESLARLNGLTPRVPMELFLTLN